MSQSIYPCLAIKGRIKEAADFYLDTFGNGEMLHASPIVVQIQLSGQKFMFLEGLDVSPNASVSFMVMSATATETENYWNKLVKEGEVLMPLDSYGWSEKYGWVQDKFGVSWQLYTGTKDDSIQKFCPTLMFTGANAGNAEAAVHFYTKVFPQSDVQGVLKYSEEDGDNTSFVKHAQFRIKQYTLMAMDSSTDHGFGFNDGISLVVECNDQEEIDSYWNQLTANGGKEVMCGWLKDKYGFSWQIIPQILVELLKEPARAQRVMGAVMKMKKLIIKELKEA